MFVSIHNKSFAELVSMKELKKYVISDMSQLPEEKKTSNDLQSITLTI